MLFFLLLGFQVGCKDATKNAKDSIEKLIYEDDFNKDLKNWTIENSEGTIFINDNGKLEIDVNEGATIWFNQKLSGKYSIEYEAIAIQQGGKNDRVSDLNCFWKAKDVDNPENIFAQTRSGRFKEYDSLELYYAGVGVHNNSKSRFRKYDGKGNKPLLPEHDLNEAKYLLKPNAVNVIKIRVENDRIRFFRNETLMYDFKDSNPINDGWFAFRTFKSHLVIDNFKVITL
jgi:hypothetical protein